MTRLCEWCGGKITPTRRKDQRYCKKACYRLAHNAWRKSENARKRKDKKEIPCITCGIKFKPRTTRVVCCSKVCQTVRDNVGRGRSDFIPHHTDCRVCGINFMKKDSLHLFCSKDCHQHFFNIELHGEGAFAIYQELMEEQKGVCAICGNGQTSRRSPRLYIDHDHDTDEIRGLLCANCNSGLGMYTDSAELLGKAKVYRESYE